MMSGNGASVARDVQWNLLGLGLPIVAAVFAVPYLIRALGHDRFGLLGIAWALTGYFALFELGMGQATTRFAADAAARKAENELPGLAWTSFVTHLVLGCLGGIGLALVAPWLVADIIAVPTGLTEEARQAFWLLAASVPFVVTASCFRGLLEARRRFDLVNLVKIPTGLVNYLGPIVALQFSPSLVGVVIVIAVGRACALFAYVALCRASMPELSSLAWAGQRVRELLSFGGWVTISSLISPFITLFDRVVIGAVVSTAAVSYYVTPYEVVTKLWILSASFMSALLPVLAAASPSNDAGIQALCSRASRMLLAAAAPMVAIILAFANELLGLWIGEDFATEAAATTRWLSVGVMINVLAQVPLTSMQSRGRAEIVARLQLVQLPVYVLIVFITAKEWGVAGAAFAWMLRAAADFVMLSAASRRISDNSGKPFLGATSLMTVALLLTIAWACVVVPLAPRMIAFAALFLGLAGWLWRVMLTARDRETIAARAFPFNLSDRAR